MKKADKPFSVLEEEPGGYKNDIMLEEDWHTAQKNSIKNIDGLSQAISLTPEERAPLSQLIKSYHMRIPSYYFSLIKDASDLQDPVRKQCVPSLEELHEGFYDKEDPLAEEKTSPTPYLVHRYPDRALLLVTGRCFMYCRHCTRRRLWSKRIHEPTLTDIEQALDYVKETESIREIIVSGGDPLTLPTEKTDYILSSIARLKHVEVIRIGTRAPVVLPQRIDGSLCRVLEKHDRLWINVQFNHPREVTPQSAAACKRLQRCGIPVSNQSVLLKGINDDPQVMTELCHKLQSIRVRPYYLFQCDPVAGASHFRTSLWKGVEIMEKMRGHTSGMCIPTFVVDGIEGKGKIPLGPDYLVSVLDEGVTLRNYKNETFFYYNPKENGKRGSNNGGNGAEKKHALGLVFNLKKDSQDDAQEEYDEIETIEALKKELEKTGLEVVLFEQHRDFATSIRSRKVDFVLNIAEGMGNTRSREAQVPCILESLGIPYSGSDPVSLGITLDKHLTSQLLASADIPVPKTYLVNTEKEIDSLKDIFREKKLFIVKPRWEGSSKGIFLNSIADNFKELTERVGYILSVYNQPVLVEEFLEGDEITVGIYGNESPRILGMMRILPREASSKPFIYSIETKRDWENKVVYQPQETIPQEIRSQVQQSALKAFSRLELRDIARVDFRVDKNNIPRIIDVNPLPGLSPRYSDLPILYKTNGGSYTDLIKLILTESFKRYGLKWKQ